MNWHDYFTYEAEDGSLRWKTARPMSHFADLRAHNRWHTLFAGKRADHASGKDYLNIGINSRNTKAHRVVWEMHNGPIPSGMFIDHVNGVKTDNRIENLRLATRSQNMMNRPRQDNNKSGFKGVYLDKKSNTWRAGIAINKKIKHLGSYPSPEKAHEAYKEAAEKIHGQYAQY